MVEVVLTYFKISGRLYGILARNIYPHCPADSVVNKRIINMLGFSQVLKPIQRQELLEERKKMAAMRFEQEHRFILAKKIFWGTGGLSLLLV